MAPETHVPCTHACEFYFIIELLIFYSRSQCNTKDFELVCDLINLIFPYKIFRLIHFIKFAICRQCTFPTTFLWKIHNFFLKETGQNFDKMHSIIMSVHVSALKYWNIWNKLIYFVLYNVTVTQSMYLWCIYNFKFITHIELFRLTLGFYFHLL